MENKTFDYNLFFNRKSIHFILVLLPIIVGLSYIFLQWIFINEIKDLLYVVLLICANELLLWGILNIGRYILKNSDKFFAFILNEKGTKEKSSRSYEFISKIFNLKLMCISGIIYGSIIGFAPKVLGAWRGNIILLILLSIFLFLINFVTGFSLYSLIRFFIYSIKLGKLIKVGLWCRENISTIFIRNITYKVAIIGSIYISIAITSTLFFAKILPMGKLTISYCTFAAIIMINIFLIPQIPIRRKFLLEKKRALDEIDYQIQKEHNNLFNKIVKKVNIVDFKEIDKLISYKGIINSLTIWSSGLKTIWTTIGILIISVLPVCIE